jgi:hypothetical protein
MYNLKGDFKVEGFLSGARDFDSNDEGVRRSRHKVTGLQGIWTLGTPQDTI